MIQSEVNPKELAAIRERKAALQSKINERDVAILTEVQDILRGRQISIFNELDERSADEIQKMFNLKSKADVEDILKRTSRFAQAAERLTDENSKALDYFHTKRQEAMNRAVKANMDGFFNLKREVPDSNIENAVNAVYRNKKWPDPGSDYDDHAQDLDQYTAYMLTDPIDDPNDPVTVVSEAHDDTLADMKLSLLNAVNNRKGKVLRSALAIFNKIQG